MPKLLSRCNGILAASTPDHQIGSGETGEADGRAGRGRHPEIAHADVGALLELVEVGDKGVGLDDVGPGGAGRLETPVEVLERLFHLRLHVAFADAAQPGIVAPGKASSEVRLTHRWREMDSNHQYL